MVTQNKGRRVRSSTLFHSWTEGLNFWLTNLEDSVNLINKGNNI
jgi:hypothetical protein